MNKTTSTLIGTCLALAAGAALAQDAIGNGEPKPKTDMTLQDCKDHMAMKQKDGMAKDHPPTKTDKMCARMIKKDGGMMKGDSMGKDAPADPMKP